VLSAASAEPWLTGPLARAYQAASAAFARVGEADASWLAANRATRWAEDAGDPLAAVASGFRMGHAFLTLGRLDQAEHVAIEAIAALRPMTDEQDCPPEALSLYGAMHLVLTPRTLGSTSALRLQGVSMGQSRMPSQVGCGPSLTLRPPTPSAPIRRRACGVKLCISKLHGFAVDCALLP